MNRRAYTRRQARLRRREVCSHARGFDPSAGYDDLNAAALLCRAEAATGVERVPLRSGDPLLYGARAMLDDGVIFYDAGVEPWLALYHQAHEFAHHWLHSGTAVCAGDDVNFAAAEDRPALGAAQVEAYGPEQRRETEANVFAREFLLPGDVLRRLFVHEGADARRIADRSGLSLDFVLHALAGALLLPDPEADADAPDSGAVAFTPDDGATPRASYVSASASLTVAPTFTLDAQQRRAAQSEHTPLVVLAGPGTGKTHALVGRVLHLLDSGVAPASILALTFSNRAAEELRDRTHVHAPDRAPHVEIHTFHSFGLELLRRYWRAAGLPPRPHVIDPTDALFVLERRLPDLRLERYASVVDPTANLPAILAAVSRAKDELCSPARYRKLAEAMLARAGGDRERVIRAERALEVAGVYDLYQRHLEAEGRLDFGDLIARSVRLLREDEAARDEVSGSYEHILVDEYQDVNRACGVLLTLLAPEGAGLWLVGDTRQAIYRWRGAAPSQMKHLRRDFPAAQVVSLEVNYRSRPPVLALVSTFAAGMSARATGDDFTSWRAFRSSAAAGAGATRDAGDNDVTTRDAAIRFEVASDERAEAVGIARLIRERHAAGVAYRRQAVICRTRRQLARVARSLESEGVPAAYADAPFDRAEARDLLAFVALASDPSPRTLLRVGRFDEYRIPFADVRRLLSRVREERLPLLRLLAKSATPAPRDSQEMHCAPPSRDETATGTAGGIARLAEHLTRACETCSPWRLLAEYLFVNSRYLAPLLADRSVAGARRRRAIYELLVFAYAETERAAAATNERDLRLALLGYVRRLKSVAADKSQRDAAPPSETGIDAVALVTVHEAKGAEWDYVYLPCLGRGHFPVRRRADRCPTPAGMTNADDALRDVPGAASDGALNLADETFPDAHLEEEECLFFVALSRARESICLSRAASYGKTSSRPSEFLDPLAARLPRLPDAPPTWNECASVGATPPASFAAKAGVTSAFTTGESEPLFTERQLANFLRCPRKYLYENVLFVKGGGHESAYVRFHACVHDALRGLRAEHFPDHPASAEAAARFALDRLDEYWRESGLAGHLHEALFREQAALMVERAARRLVAARGVLLARERTVTRPRGRILVAPDHVELIEDARGATLLLRHLRTGRPPAEAPDDPIYGLYHALAAEHFPRAAARVEALYLSTDEIIPLDFKPRTIATRLKHYDDAIERILAGDFPATPDDHLCPRCAHLFTCPRAEDAG